MSSHCVLTSADPGAPDSAPTVAHGEALASSELTARFAALRRALDEEVIGQSALTNAC